MAASCSIPDRSLRINCPISGLTSEDFAMRLCESATATTLRTAGKQPTFTKSTRATIHSNSSGYGEFCWGITASDGPGWEKRLVNGVERQFYDYCARGAPFGPDDGTVAPWVVLASLPFAPEIVIPTVRAMGKLDIGMTKRYASSRLSMRPIPCPTARPGGG
jgi:hypothetical protein